MLPRIEIAGPLDWLGPGQGRSIELAPDRVTVWKVELDQGIDPADDAVEPGAALAILSVGERARAARFVRARDRRRFARCRAALREILGDCLGVDPRSIGFTARGHGKPVLEPEPGEPPAGVRFNVSHSAGLALIAVGRDRELGVDLEPIRPVAEMDRIVENYFTAEEYAWFRGLDESARPLAFARGWTRKEAVLKGRGLGLAGLSSEAATGFGEGLLTPRFAPGGNVLGFAVWEAALAADWVAALAVETAAR